MTPSPLSQSVSRYLAEIGRRGGKKSKRRLEPEVARRMVQIREARNAFKKYHSQCFWSFDRNYVIEDKDIYWVGQQLMKHGDRSLFLLGVKLCR